MELGRARALAGALMTAADVVGDMLLEDARALAAGVPVADTTYLAGLPPLLAGHYTPAFAARFHQVFLDLGERLARPWVATTCVAQDLGTRLLADGVEVVADLAGLDLPDGWRDLLDDLLLADTDIDYLYDPAMDGFSDDPAWREAVGMVSLRVAGLVHPLRHQPRPRDRGPVTVDQRPHAPNPPRAGLVLPATLTPTWRELPRCGWVLARAFSPRRATPPWPPSCGCRGPGNWWPPAATRGPRCGPARPPGPLPSCTPSPRQRATVVIGALAGSPPWPRRSWRRRSGLPARGRGELAGRGRTDLAGRAASCMPLPVPPCGPPGTPSAQHHPTTPGVVRIDTLAAWPRGHGAGLHHLAPQLCALADEQGATLDLTARTPDLADRYTRLGFTQPDPDRLWLLRHPHPGDPRQPAAPGT